MMILIVINDNDNGDKNNAQSNDKKYFRKLKNRIESMGF